MTWLDVAQNWIVEIAGTVIFILGIGNIVLLSTKGTAPLNIATAIGVCVIGLILMGKKALASAISNIRGISGTDDNSEEMKLKW